MSDKPSEPTTIAGVPPPIGSLPIYSTADLVNSPEGVKMLAGAGALTRSPAGGYQLQIQLQEEKSASAPETVKAGSPLRAIAQDTVAQDLGHTRPDAATTNAIEQRPGSPIGTISSPYLTSDASARLINTMSEIYTALANTQKYTNQSYANYIEQQFSLTSAELQSINEKYDGERQRLLGALAGANMALIGAIISSGVNLAVSSASLMSSTRREGDPQLQPEGALRERAQKPQISDQRPESDESVRSSLTLHPQEVEAHVDPLNRGDRPQSPTSVTNAAHMPGATETGRAPSVSKTAEEDQVLEESTAMRAGDNLASAPPSERANTRAELKTNADRLSNLNAREKELTDQRSSISDDMEKKGDLLAQLSQKRSSNEGEIDQLQSELGAIGNRRDELKNRDSLLGEEGSRLQKALDGLKSDLNSGALESDLNRLKGQRADLQKNIASNQSELAADRGNLSDLGREKSRLGDERDLLQNRGREWTSEKSEVETSLAKLQEAKAAIDPKVAALLNERPNLAELFAKKPGSAPNRIEINSSDSKLNAMGANSQLSGQMRQEMAALHGRRSPTGEYGEWNSGISAFMKNHGEGTTAERKNTMAQFNDAWKKGIDLNKLEQKLTVKGTFVNPRELDAKIGQAQSRIGEINASLGRNKAEQNSIRDKLSSTDQKIETAHFGIETKRAKGEALNQRLGQCDEGISRATSDQQKLKSLDQERDRLGDRIAANKAEREKNGADLAQSDNAFNGKSQELTDHQIKNEQLIQQRSEVNVQIAHSKVAANETESALHDLNQERDALIQRRGELEGKQARSDLEIVDQQRSFGDAQAANLPRSMADDTISSTSASSANTRGVEQSSEIETASAGSQIDEGEISSQGQVNRLTLEPQNSAIAESSGLGAKPGDEVAAAREDRVGQRARAPDDGGDISPRFKSGLQNFFNLISNDGLGGLLMDASRRTGDIITQLGAIQRAQMGIQANALESAAEQGQAYIETTKELLEQLIDVTRDSSKDLDKQMESLLEVMNSISKTKTEMYNSLFLGH